MPESSSPQELLRRAVHAMGVNRPDDALRFVTEHLALTPGSVDGHCQMGLVLLELNRPREAVAAAERAAGLDPHAEWPHRVRAHAYFELGKKRQALEAARASVKLDPASPLTLFTLGQALLLKGEKREAQEVAERLRTLAPNEFYPHFLLGRVALTRRQWAEAEGHFGKALEIDPNSSAALNNLGVALENQGKRREAIERLHDAARTTPGAKQFRDNLDRSVGQYVGGGLSLLLALIWVCRGFITSLSSRAKAVGTNSGTSDAVMGVIMGLLVAVFIGVYILRIVLKRRRLNELDESVAAFYRDNRRRERQGLPLQIAFIVLVPAALVWSMFAVAGIGRPKSVLSGLAFAAVVGAASVVATVVVRRAMARKPG